MSEQRLVIPNWHPSNVANKRHHWRVKNRIKHQEIDDVYWSAKAAGWRFMGDAVSKVRLTVTLVYPRKYTVDQDNLTARCKNLVDSLKVFFLDDDTEHLELIVRAEVVKGVKATIIALRSADDMAQ